MRIVKEMPESPYSHPKPGHDCGEEIRDAELSWRQPSTFRRFGLVVECSCGLCYELRPMTFLRFALGTWGLDRRSTYSATQYWAYVRRGA